MRPQPGDVGGSAGLGWPGRVIRYGTASNVGHTFILVRRLATHADGTETWLTHEALSGGLVQTMRRTDTVVELHTVARDDVERAALLEASSALVRQRLAYDWWEVIRIGLWLLASMAGVVHLRPLAWALSAAGEWLYRYDNPRAVICSHACWQVVSQVRPDLAALSRHPADHIWPGELMRALRMADRDVLERTVLGTPTS